MTIAVVLLIVCCVALILTPVAHWVLDRYDAHQRARVERARTAYERALSNRPDK